MKNAVCIILGALFTLVCTSQEYIANRGLSFSYSSNNTWGIDMFGILGNNRFHLGYGHQFNGQEIKTVRNHKLVEEITENGDGEYFWVIDLGYS
ncbi:hypothetical protein [Gaetbulibacter saemankumensis]|uniref:hypothetical protein n=1 Tax=Gaetbulibacter saemankumensis TaxID=311208 RepID=UPI000407C0C4|nr:hypothetical protein [Gaetbulibacter saemankumensis]